MQSLNYIKSNFTYMYCNNLPKIVNNFNVTHVYLSITAKILPPDLVSFYGVEEGLTLPELSIPCILSLNINFFKYLKSFTIFYSI